MKYIIKFEDEPSMFEDGLKFYKCRQAPYWSVNERILDKMSPYNGNDYDRGIEDALETVKWLFRNVPDKDLFDGDFVEDILLRHEYQAIKDRIEWFELSRKFRIGDELVDDGKLKAGKGVVISTYPNGSIDVLWDDGSAGECFSTKDLRKTGRNFKQIKELIDLLNSRPQSPPEDMIDPCGNCKYYDVADGNEPCESCFRHKGTEERWEPK